MTEEKGTKVDYLTEDKDLPDGQNFVCISFLSPEGVKNCSVRGFKFRGAYSDFESAKRRASELQKADPLFNIFIGEGGKWLPWDPDVNDVKDQVYYEDELQKLMKAKRDSAEKAKELEQKRKENILEESIKQNKQNRKETERERLRRKLEERRSKQETKDVMPEELKEKEQTLQTEVQQVEEETKEVKNKEETLKAIDDSLEKIKSVYEKLQKKNNVT